MPPPLLRALCKCQAGNMVRRQGKCDGGEEGEEEKERRTNGRRRKHRGKHGGEEQR